MIEQDQRERRTREQEAMDNASFIASLALDLHRAVLLTANEAVLNSLPPNIMAGAQVLCERASALHRPTVNGDGLMVWLSEWGSNALLDGKHLVEFMQSNRVLLNALVRNNPSLLEANSNHWFRCLFVEPCRL